VSSATISCCSDEIGVIQLQPLYGGHPEAVGAGGCSLIYGKLDSFRQVYETYVRLVLLDLEFHLLLEIDNGLDRFMTEFNASTITSSVISLAPHTQPIKMASRVPRYADRVRGILLGGMG